MRQPLTRDDWPPREIAFGAVGICSAIKDISHQGNYRASRKFIAKTLGKRQWFGKKFTHSGHENLCQGFHLSIFKR